MSWESIPDSRALAPAALAAWDELTRQAAAAVQPELRTLVTDRVAALFGREAPTHRPAGTPTELACSEAVEQFVIDVAAMTDAQRDGVSTVLGAGTYPFFQTVYVYDFGFRLDVACEQLFGETSTGQQAAGEVGGGEVTDLWPALDRFITDVAAMDQLDPVTTEIVRLRGARAHNCRICQSRRNVTAIDNGADETTFDQIDFYEESDLADRYKVALRLVDALLWQPAAIPDAVIEDVRATFSPEETLEIVLDVVRNAANKVAVALQADQPVVNAGVEYFDIAADGSLAYGMQPPATAGAF